MLSVAIFLVWLAITNAASLGLCVLGVTLAILLPRLTLLFWSESARPFRFRPALRFLLLFFYDLIVANWSVARRVLFSPHRLATVMVEIPLDLRDPFVATLLAGIVSLTPGTLSIDVDTNRWILQVHALDSPDPSALCSEIKTRYEAALKEIFVC